MTFRQVILIFLVISLVILFFLLPIHATSAWTVRDIDSEVTESIIALDSHGYPHIAYTHWEKDVAHPGYPDIGSVKYASGPSWNTQTIITSADCNDLKIDSNDNPHILYSGQGIWHSSWTGANWTTQMIDRTGSAGGSVALDSADNPHVAYIGASSEGVAQLRYASWTGFSWNIETVDLSPLEDLYYVSSLALDKQDFPHIMYETLKINYSAHIDMDSIKYAVWNGSDWNIHTVIQYADCGNMVLDSNGYPHFTYVNRTTLMYAGWNGSDWNSHPVVSNGFISGAYLALDAYDYPNIDFYNESSAAASASLMYARWTGEEWDLQIVDAVTATHPGPIMLDSKGNPHLTYSGPHSLGFGVPDLMYAETIVSPLPLIPTSTATPTHVPSPSVPEFPSVIVLPILFVALSLTFAYVRSRKMLC